jgi:exodeoxyribonuclease V beta subunit
VPRYDYARDFGGVAYLFLRGMSRRHPPGTGVYIERPSAALLAELSDLVGEASAGSGQ